MKMTPYFFSGNHTHRNRHEIAKDCHAAGAIPRHAPMREKPAQIRSPESSPVPRTLTIPAQQRRANLVLDFQPHFVAQKFPPPVSCPPALGAARACEKLRDPCRIPSPGRSASEHFRPPRGSPLLLREKPRIAKKSTQECRRAMGLPAFSGRSLCVCPRIRNVAFRTPPAPLNPTPDLTSVPAPCF